MKKFKIISLLAYLFFGFTMVSFAISIEGWWNNTPKYTFSNNKKINAKLQSFIDNGMKGIETTILKYEKIKSKGGLSDTDKDYYTRALQDLSYIEGQVAYAYTKGGKNYIQFDFFSLPKSINEAKKYVSPSGMINRTKKFRTYEVSKNAEISLALPLSCDDKENILGPVWTKEYCNMRDSGGLKFSDRLKFGCSDDEGDKYYSYMKNCPSNKAIGSWVTIGFKSGKVIRITEQYTD